MNEIHFDIEAFLAIASAVTFIGWIIAKIKFKGDTEAPAGFMGTLIGFGYSFFPVFIFVLVIRTFVFEPFRIPSSSMMPTLLTGDFLQIKVKYISNSKIVVNRLILVVIGNKSYGYFKPISTLVKDLAMVQLQKY